MDGGHALAAHVADDQPGAGGGAHGRVEVPADLGLGLGGEVQGGGAQRAEPAGQWGQDHALGGLGDVPDLFQFLRPALAQDAEDDEADADQDQGDDLGLVVGGEEFGGVADHGDDRLGDHREGGHRADRPGAAERQGQRRGGHEQRAEVDAGWREDVDDGHRDDPHDRDDDERAALPSRPATAFDRLRHASSLHRACPLRTSSAGGAGQSPSGVTPHRRVNRTGHATGVAQASSRHSHIRAAPRSGTAVTPP